MPDRATKARAGFTLIELLVVVAIIVALLAILMPSLGKAMEAAHRAVCGSNLHQLTTVALNYAADHHGSYVVRNAGASRYAGGLHDDAGGTDQWGKRWNGYIPGYDFDSMTAHPLLYCPSSDNNGKAWRPAFSTNWRNTDYAYWPTFAPAAGVDWVSVHPLPPASLAQTRSQQTIFGDSLFEYRKGQAEWFVVSHAEGGRGGHNSYDTNLSAAPRPAGGNQASADGAVRWYAIGAMEKAVHNWGWGADGQISYQYWVGR